MNEPNQSICRISQIQLQRLIAREVAKRRIEDERNEDRYYIQGKYRSRYRDEPHLRTFSNRHRRRLSKRNPTIEDELEQSESLQKDQNDIDMPEASASTSRNIKADNRAASPNDSHSSPTFDFSESSDLSDNDYQYDTDSDRYVAPVFGRRLKDIEKKLDALAKMVETQNSLIIKNNSLLAKVCNKTAIEPIAIFPIESLEHLRNIDESLEHHSEADIIRAIKQTIGNDEIEKCCDKFFTDDVICKINWHGKADALKESKLFNKYVFESVKSQVAGYQDFISAMLEGIRFAKSRYYRKQHGLRKKSASARAALDEVDDVRSGLEENNSLEETDRSTTEFIDSIRRTGKVTIFPINTMEQFNQIDKTLASYPVPNILASIKETLKGDSIEKCFDRLFAKEVLFNTNWNGTHGQKPVKKTILFEKYVFECVKSDSYQYRDYVAAMILGFRRAKNRYYKMKHGLKKKFN